MFHNQEIIDYIHEKLLLTWPPDEIANTPCSLKIPTAKTIYRWIYEKYIPVNSKVLRRKGKSKGKKETRGKLEKEIKVSIKELNLVIGKLIPSYQAEESQKPVLQLWQKEKHDTILQLKCQIEMLKRWKKPL